MTKCLDCSQNKRGGLTNDRIRQRGTVKYYYLPAENPFLNTTDHAEFAGYCRTKGALVGSVAATGVLKLACDYADAASFKAEYAGVLDYALECGDAHHGLPAMRKDGGRVVVCSGPDTKVQFELAAAATVTMGAGEAVVPVVLSGQVHPFQVALSGALTDANVIGYLDGEKSGATVTKVNVSML